jgi:hypothetical protein
MTDRFSDPLVVRSPDSPPPHADTLLRQLGVLDANPGEQSSAIQSWLDCHPDVPWLLSFSLRERGLPDRASRAA